MTVLGATRVVPEDLGRTFDKMREALETVSGGRD
jgi:hypothetical protein